VKKPKTQAQLDRATDLRLRKTYNITLKDYEYLAALNGGGCWICGAVPATRRLHVDHDHGWKKVKIEAAKYEEQWSASAKYNDDVFICVQPKRSLAVRGAKRMLLRSSIRGLLCYQHNAGLQKFSDTPAWLDSAASYLRGFQEHSPLTGREVE